MKRKFLPLTKSILETNGVKTHEELWRKAQAQGYTGLCLAVGVEITKDAEGKKYHAVFSSETEDRHGEIVYQDFELKAFKKNPVFLDSHNYDSIEHIIGRVSPIGVKEGKLQGDIEFATMNPKGTLAQQMADNGFLNTTSIGFIPKQFDDKGNILKSELLEISAVSVPANPEALFETKNETQDAEPGEPSPKPSVSEPVAHKTDARKVASDTIRSIQAERDRHLKIIARELGKITSPDVQKRRIYQSIREVLKADIAA